MSPSCIACEMILDMLPKLPRGKSLMELCFSCFTVKVLKDFRVMAVARERSKLVPLKAMSMGNSTPLANAAINILPVNTIDVIKPLPAIPAIVLNRFILLTICSRNSVSSREILQSQLNFSTDMFMVLAVL